MGSEYMDNIKNDEYYIGKVFDDLAFVIRHMDSATPEAFSSNELLQDSMMFRLIQISENARRLSDAYRDKHSSIPWMAISGLRNRIVHDYGSVNLNVVFSTLKVDIPALMNAMKKELEESSE